MGSPGYQRMVGLQVREKLQTDSLDQAHSSTNLVYHARLCSEGCAYKHCPSQTPSHLGLHETEVSPRKQATQVEALAFLRELWQRSHGRLLAPEVLGMGAGGSGSLPE